MGGYGALRIAMRRPDVFGAVYGMSPCCLGWAADFSLENPAFVASLELRTRADFDARLPAFAVAPYGDAWLDNLYTVVLFANSAAWAPNPERPPFYADLPLERGPNGVVILESVRARWSANLPLAMLDQYLPNLRRLRAIGFDAGSADEFRHIPITARELSRRLAALGVAHEFEEYEGRHSDRAEARIGSHVLPFFSRALAPSSTR
jgi:S-formylglutathione hydrolase FrmB